jgi:CDP-glucose 4,6-dehydratase
MQHTKLSAYKGKRILVTGHTGFKGSWLTLWLKMLEADVLGYSLEPPTVPNLFSLSGLADQIIHVIGDVRDTGKLNSVVGEFKPEIVFHLAAQPLVRFSYKEPKLTYETNIMGTINLYEALRQVDSVKAIVTITSDKCYENKEWYHGYRECDPMGGYDPYSSSKGCVELITAAYRNSFFNGAGVGLASVRAGNVIGGGDWAEDRLIPDCVRSLAKGKPIEIRNPKAIRPWQHVLEPLSGYLWLGALMLQDRSKYNEGWNLGPEDDDILNVEEVVQQVIKNWGSGRYVVDSSGQPHEAAILKLDIGKARFKIKWEPVYDVFRAIQETIYWYRLYYDNAPGEVLESFTRKQIEDYIEAARKEKISWSVN